MSPHLEIGGHEGVVYDHHDVFVVIVDQLRAGLDVHNLHGGVGGSLNPHKLQQKKIRCCLREVAVTQIGDQQMLIHGDTPNPVPDKWNRIWINTLEYHFCLF